MLKRFLWSLPGWALLAITKADWAVSRLSNIDWVRTKVFGSAVPSAPLLGEPSLLWAWITSPSGNTVLLLAGFVWIGLAFVIRAPSLGRSSARRIATAEAAIQAARIERELLRATERERAQSDFKSLERRQLEGLALRDDLRRRPQQRHAPSFMKRPVGLASPLATPSDTPLYEVGVWSGDVLTALKGVTPATLADSLVGYFTTCSLESEPLELLECYLARLEQIMSQLRRRF